MKHVKECYLAEPCRSSEDGQHVMQGTVAGIPVSICGLCMSDCICWRLLKAGGRGYKEGLDDGFVQGYNMGIQDEKIHARMEGYDPKAKDNRP